MYKIITFLTQVMLILTLICCIALGINNVNVTKDVSTYGIEVMLNTKDINKSIENSESKEMLQSKCDTLDASVTKIGNVVNRSVSNTYVLFKLTLIFGMLTVILKCIELTETPTQK